MKTIETQQSFIDEREILYENSKRFFALEDNFEALYDVELESGHYVSFDRDEFYRRNVSDMVVSSTEFFDSLRANIDKVVYEEDREAAYNVQTRESIVRELAVKDHIDHYYRIITENGLMWLKMRIVYKDALKKNVIVGIFNAEEEMAAKQQEEAFKRKLIQTNARLFALEDNFESLYDVELESGHYDVFVKGDYYRNNVLNKLSVPKDYFEELRSNIDAVIYEEDRDALYNTLTRESIRGELSDAEHFDYFYRIKSGKGPVWFKMRIVYKDAERKNVIIGVFNAENDVEAKQLAEQNAKLEESLTFTNFFLDTYVSAYYVNFDDYSCRIYKRTAELERNYPIVTNYLDSINEYIRRDVHPEDREMLLDIIRPEKMKQLLQKKSQYSHIFRDIANGKEKFYRMQVIRGAEKDHAAFGFIDISEEVKEQQERLKDAEESRKLIASIAATYNLAYAVNLRDDSFKVLRMDDNIIGKDKTFSTFSEAKSFFINLLPDADKPQMSREFDYDTIRRKLAEASSYNIEYRIPIKGAIIWHEMNVTRIDNEHVAIGFVRKDLEITQRHLEDRRFSEYFALYEIDIDSGMVKIVKDSPYYGIERYGTALPYRQTVLQFASVLDEEARAFFTRLADLDYVKKIFATEEKYTYSYRSNNVGERNWVDCTSIVTLRHADGSPAMCSFGFSLLDTLGIQRLELQKQRKEHMQMIGGLASGYSTLYYANIDEGVYSIYSLDEAAYPDSQKVFDEGNDFFEIIRKYATTGHIHPDDRQLFDVFTADTIRQKLCGTKKFSVRFRTMTDNGYRWDEMDVVKYEAVNEQANAIAVGFAQRDEQIRKERERLLGAIPLSPEVFAKANIGMWAFELDEGQPPRMYHDETMLKLVGLDHQLPPEEAYHAWYDHVDKDSYGLVNDAVAKMMAGEHAEVQYPWHFPDGHTIIVRCGGIRNFSYTKGIRVEGTHQDVTQTLHFDEVERKRAKLLENELVKSKLRADELAYIADNDPDLDSAINFFGKRILEISGCDQFIFREMDGNRIVLNAPGIEDISQEICGRCPFSQIGGDVFGKDGIVLMNDCREGCRGVKVHPACPAKSSFMQQIYSGGKLVGLLSVHYLKEQHTFTDNGIDIMKTVAVYLGLLIGRINEMKAEKARIEAELSNKAKTEFLFNMSHDIRTPMNAITGFTNMAIKHIDDRDKVLDCLGKTQKAGLMLLSLINSILEVSRIESGKAVLEEQEGDIYYSFANLESTMREMAETKDIDLTFEFGKIKDRFVYADFSRCMRVFVNVISNAIKYTNDGGFVKVRCEQLGEAKDGIGTYQYTVADNGIGMSEEFQKHVFDQFARENTSTVSRIQGTGLGMSVVKVFVELMGGCVSVKSKQGVGSTFTIVLPFKIQHGKVFTDPVTGDVVTANTTSMPARQVDLAGRHVLLVEDNELNREIAQEILSEEGLVVEEAEDGSKAVVVLREKGPEAFDFVLMDIQMPVMNGYEATRAIREMYPDAQLPIIALSANAFAEDKLKSLAAGMNDHVAKPIKIKELLTALAKFIQ